MKTNYRKIEFGFGDISHIAYPEKSAAEIVFTILSGAFLYYAGYLIVKKWFDE